MYALGDMLDLLDRRRLGGVCHAIAPSAPAYPEMESLAGKIYWKILILFVSRADG